jgi:peptidyl-tRNA hydrolase
MNKLYVVVRADIPAGDQLAQSCHAVAEFGVVSPQRFTEWAKAQRNLVVLQAPGLTALATIAAQLARDGIQFAPFHEPDMGDELTAIAFGAEAAKLVSQLPLALREPRVKAA